MSAASVCGPGPGAVAATIAMRASLGTMSARRQRVVLSRLVEGQSFTEIATYERISLDDVADIYAGCVATLHGVATIARYRAAVAT